MKRSTVSMMFLFLLLILAFAVSACEKSSPTAAEQPQAQAETPKQVVKEVSAVPVETVPAELALPKKIEEAAIEKTTETAKTVEKAESGVKMVPLPIELPKPMFVGTPQNLKIPNLEKPLGKPRPPFYAPEGTTNVAAGKAVASSDEEPVIGEIDMITDGDKEASDGSFTELGPFEQNVTVDLGDRYEIYAVLFWHFHKQPRVYFDVVVQVSDDPDFVEGVKTIFNNDIDNSLGFGVGSDMHYVETSEGKLVDAKGQIARYVRLSSNGNNANELNHYIEVEVYGKPVK
ncbi:MAG: hypothetical protein JW912_00540 [Sedimentisphaerales bacterium]|nr:hypothetical protein [Sedimentisphaerales bacterium]